MLRLSGSQEGAELPEDQHDGRGAGDHDAGVGLQPRRAHQLRRVPLLGQKQVNF